AVESLFPFSGADPGLQVRSRFQSLHEARLDVVSNARELGDWPSDEDGRQPIVGGKGEQGITVAVVDFQAVESDAAPIREVPAGQRRHMFISRRIDRVGKRRISTIGPDRDPRSFADSCPTPVRPPAYPRNGRSV